MTAWVKIKYITDGYLPKWVESRFLRRSSDCEFHILAIFLKVFVCLLKGMGKERMALLHGVAKINKTVCNLCLCMIKGHINNKEQLRNQLIPKKNKLDRRTGSWNYRSSFATRIFLPSILLSLAISLSPWWTLISTWVWPSAAVLNT